MEAELSEHDACVALNLVSGIGSSRHEALVGRFGTAARALEASASELASTPGLGPELASRIAGWRTGVNLEAELRMAERGGARILTLADDAYPPHLREIADPPLCLYIRGDVEFNLRRCFAIVGTRRMTLYGRNTAEYFAGALARHGFVIVSGLAYGVDAVAHASALDAGGKTVAVLPGGLARITPQDHVPLARRIGSGGGAVVSPFPMEFPPTRMTFPMRNRIISGLCAGVLVVEAPSRSGALITAEFALEQGRQVFAVPGQIDSPQSKGCNALIKQGARLTETVEDIFDEYEFLPKVVAPSPDAASPEQADLQSLSEDERLAYDELSKSGEKAFDDLASSMKLPVGRLLGALSMLELRRLAVVLPGRRYALATGRRARESPPESDDE